jgi:hypothetical protein
MLCHPPTPPAVVVPSARTPVPGEVVPSALGPKSSSIRIESSASRIQPFLAKRLDDSRPLDSPRAQHRLQIWGAHLPTV